MPNRNYFRAFARLIKRLPLSAHLIRMRYITQRASLIIQVTCVRSVHKVMGQLKDHLSDSFKRVQFIHQIERYYREMGQ